jgi:hypothetical protein
MAHKRIDLETSLVAPELHAKLFRVDTYGLNCHTSPAYERTVEYVTELTEAVINVGVFTPVLIDRKITVIAGHGLVDVAIRIGLDDIPAIRIGDLSVEELEIFAKSMARYFNIAELEHETYLTEARQLHMILALTQTANDDQSRVSEKKSA